MKQILSALVILILASCTMAQDSEFEKDTRALLELTGSGDIGVQTMEQMIVYFKQSYTDVPSEFWDELKKEEREESPVLMLTITNSAGDVVNRITAPAGKGLHRVAWNLRYAGFTGQRSDGRGVQEEAGRVAKGIPTPAKGAAERRGSKDDQGV